MQPRTTGAIATKPTGNAQGGFWFYSLTTGRMLDRKDWTPLPMPQDVIDRITVLARRNPVGMKFTNMRNEEVYDIDDGSDSDSDDSDYEPDDDDEDDDDDDYDDFIAGVDVPQANRPDTPDENVEADEDKDNEEEDEENDEDDENEDDEENNEATENDDDEDGENDGTEEEVATEADMPTLSAPLRKLANTRGELPPILESRTRQTAQDNDETLVTRTTAAHPLSKKKRKLEKELQKQIIKRYEEEQKQRLRNKLKNAKQEEYEYTHQG